MYSFMSKIFIGIIFTLGILDFLDAQQMGFCGTEDQHLIIERLQENRANFKDKLQARTGNTQYVPVIYHMVADNSGNDRVDFRDVMEMHCFLNQFYDSLDIQFYIAELNMIDNSSIHTDPRSPNGQVRIRLAKKNTGMNIFLVKTIGGSQTGGGITLGYYSPADDYLVVQQNQVNGYSSTLAHEVGHFFTLAHTFYGWEATTYDPTKPTPKTVSLGSVLVNVEYVDRSKNCHNAADNFCDTPPDYLLGFQNPGGGCSPYTGPAKDPDGVPVDPQENNLMSYFERCVFYVLSQEQQNAIHADLQSVRRSFLRRGWTPPAESITDDVNYLSPSNQERLQVYVNIPLDWEDVPGATKYLVEVDRVNSFSSEVQTFVTEESYIEVPELRKNFNYFWRVRPFNDYTTCTVARFQTFRTGDQTVSVNNVSGLDHWTIQPNPVPSGQFHAVLQTSEPIDGMISVFDLQGREIWKNSLNLTPGEHRIPVQLEISSSGIYFVRIATQTGINTRKLVIQP